MLRLWDTTEIIATGWLQLAFLVNAIHKGTTVMSFDIALLTVLARALQPAARPACHSQSHNTDDPQHAAEGCCLETDPVFMVARPAD